MLLQPSAARPQSMQVPPLTPQVRALGRATQVPLLQQPASQPVHGSAAPPPWPLGPPPVVAPAPVPLPPPVPALPPPVIAAPPPALSWPPPVPPVGGLLHAQPCCQTSAVTTPKTANSLKGSNRIVATSAG